MIDAILQFWQQLQARPDFWGFITIPIVASVVTWLHVWMALKMVFYPISFWGFKLGNLPIGWQGIVPRKAGKISGILVDQSLSKIGSLDEFFREMRPDEMAEFISETLMENVEEFIDEVMADRNRTLWENLPNAIKRRVYQHVRKQIPSIMESLVTELTFNVENLVDMRQMVVSQMENDRALMVRMFLRVGQKEIDYIWHMSFWIGLFFGFVQMVIWLFVPWHWTIVFWAGLWGLLTNWIAIWMVFNPIEPKKVLGMTWHGAFMRRQEEVSEVFSHVSTRELFTIKQIMSEMMFGPKADKTRKVIKRHIGKMLDSPVVRTTIQMTMGWEEYAKLKDTIIDKSIHATMVPISDPDLNESRAAKVNELFLERMKKLTPMEFQNLLRPAFREDEWILVVLGGVTGALAGWIQLMLGFK
ncbi:hypothetical protein [Agitococcus lubricus]|uniref:DUF445 domain-containing protein n=1 Tax=Agitococcus lubricus TaxID=1077255 RepID=A0A2T5IWB4_9GAMM|nr:hypothetical protein [Agitococcus lubricus]PTQ88185.1 hypothetical protein C8N29_11445 [Agitococcus lubricus]